MAAGFYFDAFEVRILARDLDRAGPVLVERTETVVDKTGNDTVSDGQAACPVDTGHLRSTIGVDFDADRLGFEAGPTASYGGYVHWGTSRMAPQPYLTPAFDLRVDLATQALEQAVGRVFD